MNLPNKLTISRIFLTFVFMLFVLLRKPFFTYMSMIVFMIAVLTDYYDGKIARKLNIETNFGKLMDPIADKMLVFGAFLALVELKVIPAWMVVCIMSRELLITGLRLSAASKGIILSADKIGKHKTVSQFIAILSGLFYLILRDAFNVEILARYLFVVKIITFITVVLTLISGLSYLWNNRDLLKNEKLYN